MKILSFVMALLLFAMPFLTLAQQSNDAAQAIMDAERDAQLADTQIWALAGCVGGLLGVIAAYAVTPTVPSMKLIGKSPEYVAYYTTTYQQKVRSLQTQQATMGCFGGVLLSVLGYVILLELDTSTY